MLSRLLILSLLLFLSICPTLPAIKIKDCSTTQFRTLGGEADQKEFMVLLKIFFAVNKNGSRNFYLCGGTLISRQHILTAAHCLDHKDIIEIKAYVGSPQFDRGISLRVGAVHKHPNFSHSPADPADIAVIELEKRAPAMGTVRTIVLATRELEDRFGLLNCSLYISGWGLYSRGSNTTMHEAPSQEMMTAEVPKLNDNAWFVSSKTYFESKIYVGYDPQRQLCTGGFNKGTGKGDSGGPVYVLYRRQFYQVGVIQGGALGTFVDRKRFPDHSARVSAFLNFIYRFIPSPPTPEAVTTTVTTTEPKTTTTTTTTITTTGELEKITSTSPESESTTSSTPIGLPVSKKPARELTKEQQEAVDNIAKIMEEHAGRVLTKEKLDEMRLPPIHIGKVSMNASIGKLHREIVPNLVKANNSNHGEDQRANA